MKRWSLVLKNGTKQLVPADDGDIVLYIDHCSQELDLKIQIGDLKLEIEILTAEIEGVIGNKNTDISCVIRNTII